MAEEEPVLTSPPTQEDARHVRDYTLFVRLLTWGAILSAAVAFFVLIFVL